MPKRRPPPALLTAVELEMMRVLWQHGPATVQGVLERLERPLAYTSVLTMLRILEKKGYARHAPSPDGGRAHVYSAAIRAEDAQQGQVKQVLERYFGGRPEELVVGLLESEELDAGALERIRAALEQRKRQRRGAKE